MTIISQVLSLMGLNLWKGPRLRTRGLAGLAGFDSVEVREGTGDVTRKYDATWVWFSSAYVIIA